jgi:hypothetical protein
MGASEDTRDFKYSYALRERTSSKDVNRRRQDGSIQIAYEGRGGFLAVGAPTPCSFPPLSLLRVFSRRHPAEASSSTNRVHAPSIATIRVMLAWCARREFIEVAAPRPKPKTTHLAGVVFYTLEQR